MAAYANATFAALRVHCSFTNVERRRSPNKISKSAVPPLRSVACPDTLEKELFELVQRVPSRSAPSLLECRELLEFESGGAVQVAERIRHDSALKKELWADDTLATSFLTSMISETNFEAVEDVLLHGRPRRRPLATAAGAFADKRSVRGVAFIERLALKRGILKGSESTELWFSLMRAYGILEKLDSVRRCFKAAREANAWSLDDTKFTNIYLNAMHTDIRVVFVRARQLLDSGAVPDAATFNILLKACMRAKDSKRADLAMKWMADAVLEADAVTWSSLIKVRSYTGDFEGVLAIRDAMEAAGFEPTPSVWGSLLVACGTAQHHETALMVWREAKAALGGPASVPPNLYNAMLIACTACGQGERSLTILEEMKAAGVQPTVKSYNLAIKACEGRPGQRLRLEQVAIALKLYEEMRVDGMHPDLITYGTLIELCAEGRQGALARRLRERMDEDGVKPNVVVLTSLLKALARGGLIEECLKIFSKMIWGPARARPNRVTFRTLVRELRQAGALGAALRTYEGMRRAHYAPSNIEFQELIAAAAEAALAEGDPELQAQVASLCNIGSSLTEVDLHGMSSLEARAAVLCVLSMLMTEYHDSGVPPTSLSIITGKGGHSEGGEAVLPGIVMRLLREELKMMVGAPCEQGEENAGRIVLDPEQLLRWLRARVATRQQHKRNCRKAAAAADDF